MASDKDIFSVTRLDKPSEDFFKRLTKLSWFSSFETPPYISIRKSFKFGNFSLFIAHRWL
jgi:hypothetical protein